MPGLWLTFPLGCQPFWPCSCYPPSSCVGKPWNPQERATLATREGHLPSWSLSSSSICYRLAELCAIHWTQMCGEHRGRGLALRRKLTGFSNKQPDGTSLDRTAMGGLSDIDTFSPQTISESPQPTKPFLEVPWTQVRDLD